MGFQAKLDEQLLKESDVNNLEEWQKHVVLMFDEMKIKEDLVCDKRTGELTGFVNLGDINDHLQHFEQVLSSDTSAQPSLASSMFVFMVKGIFTKLEFPYAHFPCTNLTAEVLYPIVWDAVRRLEALGLKVLVLTCDGAGPNRKFYRLHKGREEVKRKSQQHGRGVPQEGRGVLPGGRGVPQEGRGVLPGDRGVPPGGRGVPPGGRGVPPGGRGVRQGAEEFRQGAEEFRQRAEELRKRDKKISKRGKKINRFQPLSTRRKIHTVKKNGGYTLCQMYRTSSRQHATVGPTKSATCG